MRNAGFSRDRSTLLVLPTSYRLQAQFLHGAIFGGRLIRSSGVVLQCVFNTSVWYWFVRHLTSVDNLLYNRRMGMAELKNIVTLTDVALKQDDQPVSPNNASQTSISRTVKRTAVVIECERAWKAGVYPQ